MKVVGANIKIIHGGFVIIYIIVSILLCGVGIAGPH